MTNTSTRPPPPPSSSSATFSTFSATTTMTVFPVTLASLKKAKNSVIGNPQAKIQLVRDDHFVSAIIECLNPPVHDPPVSGSEKAAQDAVRTEAAHVIASLSYGSEEALGKLLRANAHYACLYAISSFTTADPPSLRSAFSRALRALAASTADIVGPSMWGLRPDGSSIRNEAQQALNHLFQIESLDIYLPLLVLVPTASSAPIPIPTPSPSSSSVAVATSTAQMLSAIVRSEAHRRVVTEWLPQSERQREIKSRRGWEKTALSVNQSAPWIAKQLLTLLGDPRREGDAKLVEASLSALAAMVKENLVVATYLTKANSDKESVPPLDTILKFTKSRSIDVQLAACLCVAHTLRAAPPPPPSIMSPLTAHATSPSSSHPSSSLAHSFIHTPTSHKISLEEDCTRTVINVVNRLIATPPSLDSIGSSGSEFSQTQTKACYILHHLVSDDANLSHAAFDRGCLDHLGNLIKSINPKDSDPMEWEEGEPESLASLREAALIALASLALCSDDIRRRVTDELGLLPCISRALRAKRHVGTRYAACQCVRAMSRAVSVLRTSIVDSGLGMDVLRIVLGQELGDKYGGSAATPAGVGPLGNSIGKGKEGVFSSKARSDDPMTDVGGGSTHSIEGGAVNGLGEDRRVLGAALSAVCNIVNDFSPLRPIYLEQKLMPRLVYILRESGDPALRLNALWAIKNLVRKTSTETKRDIMSCVGWSHLSDFLSDADEDIQEQGFYTLRNLAENEDGIAMVFRELGSEVLSKIVAGLRSSCEDVVLQSAFAVANLANGTHEQQDMILHHPGLLTSLQVCLAESTSTVRRPAVACVLTLAQSNPRRRKEMVDAGIVGTLKRLCEWSGHSTHGHGSSGMGLSSPPTGGHWGGRSPIRSTVSHQMPSSGYGSWGGSGSMHHHQHHHAHGNARTQNVAGHGSHHSWSSPMALEDDRDVIQRARTALEWLERGETYLT